MDYGNRLTFVAKPEDIRNRKGVVQSGNLAEVRKRIEQEWVFGDSGSYKTVRHHTFFDPVTPNFARIGSHFDFNTRASETTDITLVSPTREGLRTLTSRYNLPYQDDQVRTNESSD